jgi:hypothetical protein
MKIQIKMYAIIVIAFFSMFLVSCSKDDTDVPDPNNNKGLPVLTNATITDSSEKNRPVISAEITSDGGSQITQHGISYDTMPNPTIDKQKRESDSAKVGVFSFKLGGLKPNTKYYARAYATNSTGTGYSNQVEFSTGEVRIGDYYRGGIVFYLEPSGKHGLISALPGNNHAGEWGCTGVSVPGTRTEIGTGQANTKLIIAACAGDAQHNAAKWCDELVDNGWQDWFLPSRDELAEMYKYRDLIGFNGATRWSSSEADANTVWVQDFGPAGGSTTMNKSTATVGIRAISAF